MLSSIHESNHFTTPWKSGPATSSGHRARPEARGVPLSGNVELKKYVPCPTTIRS